MVRIKPEIIIFIAQEYSYNRAQENLPDYHCILQWHIHRPQFPTNLAVHLQCNLGGDALQTFRLGDNLASDHLEAKLKG